MTTELELHSEERFREIVELMPAAVYVCDMNGSIQQFNRKAVELWGREPYADEDVRFCGAIQHLRLDGSIIPRDELPIAETIRNGKPVRNQELLIERADGSRVVVMINVAPLRNAEGVLVGAINCFLDVTDRHQAEERLRQSERRLAEAQQVAHIGSWERDLRTNQVIWSDELYRLFGVREHEIDLSYEQFLNRLVPEEVDRARKLVTEAIRERRPFSVDYRIIRADGSIRVLHDRGSVILNEQGAPIRLVGTCQDVTERREAEQELQRQKVILQTIFDNIPVMISFVDASSRVQMVNRHWERVLGWSLEDAQSRDLLLEAYPDPADRARVIEYTLHPTPEWTDFKVRVHDGRTLDTIWSLIVLPDGTRIGLGQDITERKRAEDALQQSEERLFLAIHAADLGIFENDHQTNILYWSPMLRAILGWGAQEAASLEVYFRLTHPADRDRIVAAVYQALGPMSDGQYRVEHRVVRPDGGIRWISVWSRTSFEGGGDARRPLRTVGIVAEITERKRAEEALRQSEDRIRSIIDAIPVMAWSVQLDGIIDFLNQRWTDYAGLSLEQYLEEPTRPIHPEDIPRVFEKWRAQMAAGEGYEDEMRLRRHDGQYRWFLVRTEPLRQVVWRVYRYRRPEAGRTGGETEPAAFAHGPHHTASGCTGY
jgi:PAS domain S-box-containing protein